MWLVTFEDCFFIDYSIASEILKDFLTFVAFGAFWAFPLWNIKDGGFDSDDAFAFVGLSRGQRLCSCGNGRGWRRGLGGGQFDARRKSGTLHRAVAGGKLIQQLHHSNEPQMQEISNRTHWTDP